MKSEKVKDISGFYKPASPMCMNCVSPLGTEVVTSNLGSFQLFWPCQGSFSAPVVGALLTDGNELIQPAHLGSSGDAGVMK